MTKTTVDFLVVGSGIAGLTAAIVAKELGLDVVVVEKASQIGGTSAYSMGLIWAPANKYAKAAGIADTAEEAVAHIRALSGGRHDDEILQAYPDLINGAMSFLEDGAGIPFEYVPGYPDYYCEREGGKTQGRYIGCPVFAAHSRLPKAWRDRVVHSPYYRSRPGSWREVQRFGGMWNVKKWQQVIMDVRAAAGHRGFGSALMGFLASACLERHIDLRTDTAAEALIQDGNGKVVGAKGHDADGPWEINVRHGVLLAAGGYDANGAMQARLDPHPPAFALGSPTVDGSGITMALEAGAAFVSLGGQLLVPTYQIPGELVDGRPLWRMFVREPALPGSIVVNIKGQRFADESFYRDLCWEMARYNAATGSHPNKPAFFVFDAQWKSRYDLGPRRAGQAADWIHSGDSTAELGRKSGIDSKTLQETILRFNEHAAHGLDPDFGRGSHLFGRFTADPDNKPNPSLRPLQPPLHAIPVCLGTSGTNSGLRVDASARVIDWRGRVMPGLYAAGNCMANLVEGLWYNSGIAMGRGMAFGYAAARHAAEQAQPAGARSTGLH